MVGKEPGLRLVLVRSKRTGRNPAWKGVRRPVPVELDGEVVARGQVSGPGFGPLRQISLLGGRIDLEMVMDCFQLPWLRCHWLHRFLLPFERGVSGLFRNLVIGGTMGGFGSFSMVLVLQPISLIPLGRLSQSVGALPSPLSNVLRIP